MKNPVSVKTIKISIIIVLALLFSPQIMLAFSSPSGQTTSIEGGGFCGSASWVIYNNTGVDNKLYAMNCQSGINVFSAFTDLGALITSNIIPDCVAYITTPCNEIALRAGYYSVVTSIVIGLPGTNNIVGPNGIDFHGAGSGHSGQDFNLNNENGTLLVAKTANMEMIKEFANSNSVTCTSGTSPTFGTCTGGNQPLADIKIHNILLSVGTVTGVIGIDWSNNEQACSDKIYDTQFHGFFNGGAGVPFAVSLRIRGCEGTIVDNINFAGDGGSTDGSATIDLDFEVPAGSALISNTFFGGVLSEFNAQSITIMSSVPDSIKVIGNIANIYLDGSGMGNSFGTSHFQLNGFIIYNLVINGGFWLLGSGPIPNMFAGTGTVDMFSISGTTWDFTGSTQWNLNGATLTNQVSLKNNWVWTGSAPTNFPFVITSNVF